MDKSFVFGLSAMLAVVAGVSWFASRPSPSQAPLEQSYAVEVTDTRARVTKHAAPRQGLTAIQRAQHDGIANRELSVDTAAAGARAVDNGARAEAEHLITRAIEAHRWTPSDAEQLHGLMPRLNQETLEAVLPRLVSHINNQEVKLEGARGIFD